MAQNSRKVFTPLEKPFSILLRYYTSPKYINDKMTIPHFHEQYELVYVSSGSIIYKIENQTYQLERGDFALIPPYVAHMTSDKSELEMYVINFTKSYIEQYLNQVTVNDIFSNLTGRIYHRKNSTQVFHNNRNFIRQIYDEYEKNGKFDNNSICPYLLFALLQSIIKYYSTKKLRYSTGINTEKPLINLVLEYIDLHYAQITNLEDIAKPFFISKTHLCVVFKKATGITPIQYLSRLKIKRAIELFKTTDYSAKKISEVVGFESNSYFTKVFKKITGYSPTSYRKTVFQHSTSEK